MADVTVDFVYNEAGQITSIDRYEGEQLAVEADYSCDTSGRLVGLVYHQGDTMLNSYTWTYSGDSSSSSSFILQPSSFSSWLPTGGLMPVHDTTGVVDAVMAGGLAGLDLVTSATSNDGTASYSYDPTGQLIGATYTGGQSDEAYAYDANGNRTSANGSTYVTGVDNRLISDGTYTYSYDAEGNRTARFIDGNHDGVFDAGDRDINVYGWDVRNRLTSVTTSATFGADPTQIVQYRYDPEDRLIAETVDSNGDGVVDHQTYFVYDGHEIVLQFDSSSPLPSGEGQGEGVTAANLSHRYLWDPVVDQVLADEQLSPLPVGEGQGVGYDLSAPGNIVWPLADNLGTARDLAITDPQTGLTTVANHRVFDSYGNLKSQTNAAVDYIFGFTGFLTDKATGLYMSQTRPYDPRVGRWAQPDRIGLLGRDTNPSRYCGNSPTNRADPTGESWLSDMWNWLFSSKPSPQASEPWLLCPNRYDPDFDPTLPGSSDPSSPNYVRPNYGKVIAIAADATRDNFKEALSETANKVAPALPAARSVLGARKSQSVARWEADLERGAEIAKEMAKRGCSKKQIAEWLAASKARAQGRMQRVEDGISTKGTIDRDLPRYPAPWE